MRLGHLHMTAHTHSTSRYLLCTFTKTVEPNSDATPQMQPAPGCRPPPLPHLCCGMVVHLAPHFSLQLWGVDAAVVHQLLTPVCCCHRQWLRAGRLLPSTSLAAGMAQPVLLAVLASLLLVQLEGTDDGQGVAVSCCLHVVVSWAAAAVVWCVQLMVALLGIPYGV